MFLPRPFAQELRERIFRWYPRLRSNFVYDPLLWMKFCTESLSVTVPRDSRPSERPKLSAGPVVLGQKYHEKEQMATSSESGETDSTESSESEVVPKDPRPVSPIAAPEVRIILLFAFIVVRTHPLICTTLRLCSLLLFAATGVQRICAP